jgi:hypothetical protein
MCRHCGVRSTRDLLELDCAGAEYDILFATSKRTLDSIHHVVAEYHDGMNEHRSEELDGFPSAHGFSVVRFPRIDEECGHFDASRRAISGDDEPGLGASRDASRVLHAPNDESR